MTSDTAEGGIEIALSVGSVIFPIDLPGLFLGEIEKQRRPPDGMLHASSDLTGSLRHTQLRAVGAPTKGRPVAQDIRLMHGTLWHEWWHKTLIQAGVPFFHELNLTKYMPEGWSGTADWVFWHPDYRAFMLGDLKTAKGEAIYWINNRGAKDEHIWQLSAYFYALVNMGLPMVKGFGVMYWPMNDTNDKDLVLPTLQDCEPYPEDVVFGRMVERWLATKRYKDSIIPGYPTDGPEQWLTDLLAPEQDRIQQIIWSKPAQVFNLTLVPHWSARFCDFGPPLCDCGTRGVTKIGHYTLDGGFVPRRGYEDVQPTVSPSPSDFNKRRKEADGS
jgi:hypothetical protein